MSSVEGRVVHLNSSCSDARLEFSEFDGRSARIALVASDHSATRVVWFPLDEPGLDRFFTWCARDWKGWTGTRTWSTVEGEFALTCESDRLGHVTLTVEIASSGGIYDSWTLRARLGLDAGALERIAREFEHFFEPR